MYIIDSLIPTDIADLHAEGFAIAFDSGIPEVLGLYAIADNIAQAVNLDFCITLPRSLLVCIGTVEADPFDGF